MAVVISSASKLPTNFSECKLPNSAMSVSVFSNEYLQLNSAMTVRVEGSSYGPELLQNV